MELVSGPTLVRSQISRPKTKIATFHQKSRSCAEHPENVPEKSRFRAVHPQNSVGFHSVYMCITRYTYILPYFLTYIHTHMCTCHPEP